MFENIHQTEVCDHSYKVVHHKIWKFSAIQKFFATMTSTILRSQSVRSRTQIWVFWNKLCRTGENRTHFSKTDLYVSESCQRQTRHFIFNNTKSFARKSQNVMYKLSFLHQLDPGDCSPRLNHGCHILRELQNDSGHFKRVMFSGECVLLTNGVVNKHNARARGQENLYIVQEVPQISEKITAWCRINKTMIIGFYFFLRTSCNW